MATSAIWQSPVDLNFQTNHSQASTSVTGHQRPKLSINTKTQLGYGRSSSGLRLDTLSASSPTIRNTYRNTYEAQSESTNEYYLLAQSRSIKSASREWSSEHQCVDVAAVPYTLPSETRSILANGPLNECQRASLTSCTSTKQSVSTRKAQSVQKRVSFREPLSEEIRNTRFVLRHSDLRSRSNSPSSRTSKTKKSTPRRSSRGSPPPLKSRNLAAEPVEPSKREDEVDSPLSSSSEEENGDIKPPKTPVLGRLKKEREWIWTLGPLPGANGPGAAASIESQLDEDLDDSLEESVAAASAFLSRDDVNAGCTRGSS